MTHRFSLRVYYEDTDMAGIVYYATSLKFIARARSDWVREMGIDQLAMKADGVVFAVRRVEADYLAPATFGDMLEVRTGLDAITPARMVMGQEVWRDQTCLFKALGPIVRIGQGGKPARLPAKHRSIPTR